MHLQYMMSFRRLTTALECGREVGHDTLMQCHLEDPPECLRVHIQPLVLLLQPSSPEEERGQHRQQDSSPPLSKHVAGLHLSPVIREMKVVFTIHENESVKKMTFDAPISNSGT